ncbi:MAG: alpha/beta hydrolase [Deltaproteobacteria bacterium]|nr:alpha/beta hydrolase [Deltaproteobacteria bacterium]
MENFVLRREGRIALSDRGERYRYAWLPPAPRRAMILVHGYAEHAGRYDAMATWFAARGFAVHAYDQAGHGRTRGPRGHVDRFERLLDELSRFVEQIAADHPGLPIALVGHSMGGLVVAATAVFRRPAVEWIVLSGALLEMPTAGSFDRRLRLLAARFLSAIAPRIGLSTGLDAAGLSRDPEVVRRYLEDPYVKDRMSARFAAGLAGMVERVASSADRVERPILVLHGGDDPICPVSGSRRFHAGLDPAIANRSRLSVYPGLRHEIFNEPEHEAIWREVLEWMGE